MRAFGTNWWTKQWIEALERFGWDGRLQRGRTYARSGHVRSIDIKPGKVVAKVKGSQPRPYTVTLALPQISDAAWEAVIDALAGEARYAASLLAGEMPATIEEVFAARGAHLFPQPDEGFETDCSCPDWVNPCKHVAAVHYVLGGELDRDPFLLFRLRGRSKEAVLAGLRARRGVGSGDPAELPAEAPSEGTEPPLAERLDDFWTLGPELRALRFSIAGPRVPEAVLKRLGSPTGPQEGELPRAELARAYRTVSERALRSAGEE